MRMIQQEIHAAFDLVGLPLGRHFGSKTDYRSTHPGCRYIPNASIFIRTARIWGGDLDLLHDGRALCSISRLLNRKLFITFEQEKRSIPHSWVLDDTVASVWQGRVKYFCRRKSVIPGKSGGAWW